MYFFEEVVVGLECIEEVDVGEYVYCLGKCFDCGFLD